jgi:hypothetical protein
MLGVGGSGYGDVDEERESVVRFVARPSFLFLFAFSYEMFEGLWREFRMFCCDCVNGADKEV